ncbi:MAG: hypothetical protein ACOX5W_13450 [Bacillota bacterium]
MLVIELFLTLLIWIGMIDAEKDELLGEKRDVCHPGVGEGSFF